MVRMIRKMLEDTINDLPPNMAEAMSSHLERMQVKIFVHDMSNMIVV